MSSHLGAVDVVVVVVVVGGGGTAVQGVHSKHSATNFNAAVAPEVKITEYSAEDV